MKLFRKFSSVFFLEYLEITKPKPSSRRRKKIDLPLPFEDLEEIEEIDTSMIEYGGADRKPVKAASSSDLGNIAEKIYSNHVTSRKIR